MKVLLLTPYLPHRRVGHGGGTAVRSLVAALARLHRVRVVSLIRPGEEALAEDVRALGVEVAGVPFLDRNASGWRRAQLLAERAPAFARATCGRYPFYVTKYGAPGLQARIVAEVQAFAPDVVQVEYLQLSLPLRALRRRRDRRREPGAPRLVLDSHELSSLSRRRRAAAATSPVSRALLRAEARAWERLQVDATRWADATLCVTPQDHALLASLGGVNVRTVPLGVDTQELAFRPPHDAPPRALFLGSFQHPPNRSAARALLERIWPGLRRDLPGWELVLAGRGSQEYLDSLASSAGDDVRALGFVEDLGELFASCRLLLAPLSEGGGIKIKILEAMARGLPVVTTPIGAEGITDAADDTVWLAAGLDDFATAAVAAATRPHEVRARAERARRRVEEHFSWRAIADRLTAIYTEIQALDLDSRAPRGPGEPDPRPPKGVAP